MHVIHKTPPQGFQRFDRVLESTVFWLPFEFTLGKGLERQSWPGENVIAFFHIEETLGVSLYSQVTNLAMLLKSGILSIFCSNISPHKPQARSLRQKNLAKALSSSSAPFR